MASLNNPIWEQWKPFNAVHKVRTYVALPAFTYATNWLGYSELITQFNFSADRSFYLKRRPAKPSGVNYQLCIKYRVGNAVFRYRLWGVSLTTGLDEIPLYTNQIIKKNFVLEVWSTENLTASQATAINLITSVVQIPDDISDLDDVALATGVEFNSYSPIDPVGNLDFPVVFQTDTGWLDNS